MLTKSEENYIKEIYALEQKCQADVNTNMIAEKLSTKASSVSDMLKKLAKKDLIVYQKYKGVKLNKRGNNIALSIVRKHRLWETFLVEKLNFSWDEVHEIAEQLEHVQSEKLTDELDAFLNFPNIDPHGDPIPDKFGKFNAAKTICLGDLSVGQEALFVEVKNDSDIFLKYLTKNNLALGATIKVVDKEEYDKSVTIDISNKQFNISENVVKNIYVKI